MQIQEIPLARLHPHPDNSNVMPERTLKKLTAHIERTDRYPPILVRPRHAANEEPAFEILDGHHRVEALRRLARPSARCVAWDVDDEEALLLMATLNRLAGDDDARKRAALVAKLHERHDLKSLAGYLPEQREHLEKLLTLRQSPPPRPPQPMDAMPQAVHFFLLPEQRRRLESRLKRIGGTREAALMTLVDEAAATSGA